MPWTTTSQETSTTTISCRSMARSIDHAWKQAPRHRDVVPLDDSSPETFLHDYNTVAQEYSTSTLCLALTYSSYKRTSSSSQIMLSISPSRRRPKDTFLGACHEIYVRLIVLHHRTQDRHTFSVSIKSTPRSPRKKSKASTRCSIITKIPSAISCQRISKAP